MAAVAIALVFLTNNLSDEYSNQHNKNQNKQTLFTCRGNIYSNLDFSVFNNDISAFCSSEKLGYAK